MDMIPYVYFRAHTVLVGSSFGSPFGSRCVRHIAFFLGRLDFFLGRKFDFFINHCQASGQDQAANLAKELKSLGAQVWYDMTAQKLDELGMEEGVSQSRNVIIFLSGQDFSVYHKFSREVTKYRTDTRSP